MSEEETDDLKRVVTFVGTLVITFTVTVLLIGTMLILLLSD